MSPTLVFDCDGVLADTERYGHLPAFNQTFAEFGLPVRWSEEDYAQKLLIGGGKERMRSLLTPEFVAAKAPRAAPETVASLPISEMRKSEVPSAAPVPERRWPKISNSPSTSGGVVSSPVNVTRYSFTWPL